MLNAAGVQASVAAAGYRKGDEAYPLKSRQLTRDAVRHVATPDDEEHAAGKEAAAPKPLLRAALSGDMRPDAAAWDDAPTRT